MTIEEELKELIIKHAGSVNRFATLCGVPYSTLATLFVRGINKANISTLIAICKELRISADELANGRITPYQNINPNMEYINLSDLSEENQKRLKDYYELLKGSQNGKS